MSPEEKVQHAQELISQQKEAKKKQEEEVSSNSQLWLENFDWELQIKFCFVGNHLSSYLFLEYNKSFYQKMYAAFFLLPSIPQVRNLFFV